MAKSPNTAPRPEAAERKVGQPPGINRRRLADHYNQAQLDDEQHS